MKRRLKLSVTRIRRQTATINGVRIYCPTCGVDSGTLSLKESAGFLKLESVEIEELITTGAIHVIRTVGEIRLVCINSLFKIDEMRTVGTRMGSQENQE